MHRPSEFAKFGDVPHLYSEKFDDLNRPDWLPPVLGDEISEPGQLTIPFEPDRESSAAAAPAVPEPEAEAA